ncbi:MAG: hypothetical protein HY914_23075 [Desulfomonile tiedjei]|nr:hypothetical protein [Desulfomonile tiedjei]
MKHFFSSLVAALLAAALLSSCIPGLRSSRTAPEPGSPMPLRPGQPPVDASKALKPLEKPTAGAQTAAQSDLKSPPLPDEEKVLAGRPGLHQRSEINQAALDFAQNYPHVKYVKTCFSKLYGGWYLILYVARGKKTDLQQFSWNDTSKEWEPVFRQENLPKEQIEYHVKGEVGDEKCFVLKSESGEEDVKNNRKR